MQKLTAKKIILLILLALPIIFMVVYTIKGNAIPQKSKTPAEQIKIASPSDTADEIAALIEQNDFENAIAKIEKDLQDPNVPSSKGVPLIVMAAQANNYELVSALIAAGADVNAVDVNTGRTALMAAAQANNPEMINLLLVANGNPNIADNQGATPLTIAINLFNRTSANYLTARGATAGISKENLLNYAFKSNPTGVEIMLSGGVDPNYSDENGNNALIVCASKGDLPCVKLLLTYKASKNAANSLGMTPLLYAIKAQKWDVVKELIDGGADVNKANKKNETPLYWASYIGNTKLAQDLLILGADYKTKTAKGETALQISRKNGHPQTEKAISDFIAFKNIPRDKKGNPIIPKSTSKEIAQKAQAKAKEIKFDVKIAPIAAPAAKTGAADKKTAPAAQPSLQTKQTTNQSEIDELIKSGALSPEQAALLMQGGGQDSSKTQSLAIKTIGENTQKAESSGEKRVIGTTTVNKLQVYPR